MCILTADISSPVEHNFPEHTFASVGLEHGAHLILSLILRTATHVFNAVLYEGLRSHNGVANLELLCRKIAKMYVYPRSAVVDLYQTITVSLIFFENVDIIG